MEDLIWLFMLSPVFVIIWQIMQDIEEKEKVKQMKPEERRKYEEKKLVEYRRQQEREEREKYNNFMYTCPMCGSKKIKNIDTAQRGVSVAAFGLSSGKIGKCYECDNCKYKW